MTKGKIKWYNETKGYGFILTDDNQDIFVHRSGLSNSVTTLDTDQKVEFETRPGEKGTVAINVKYLS